MPNKAVDIITNLGYDAFKSGVEFPIPLKAKQLSKRGGILLCELEDDRVYLSGNALLYMRGEIFI